MITCVPENILAPTWLRFFGFQNGFKIVVNPPEASFEKPSGSKKPSGAPLPTMPSTFMETAERLSVGMALMASSRLEPAALPPAPEVDEPMNEDDCDDAWQV